MRAARASSAAAQHGLHRAILAFMAILEDNYIFLLLMVNDALPQSIAVPASIHSCALTARRTEVRGREREREREREGEREREREREREMERDK
jgi:hypothetical protein